MFQRTRGSRRRRPFVCESLENRNLLSTLTTSQPAAEVQSTSQTVSLQGTIDGFSQIVGGPVMDGENIIVPVLSYGNPEGSGALTNLGTITSFEAFHHTKIYSPTYARASIADGTGTFTLAGGTIDIEYTARGVLNSSGGFEDVFVFTVVGGTGQYEGATGHGTIITTEVPVPGRPGLYHFVGSIHGSITF